MSYDSTILAESNLLAYYPLNETVGPTVFDATSNHANGTLHGTVTLNQVALAAGLDPCMLFDGTTGYITLPTSVEPGEPLTIEMWVKVNSVGFGGNILYGANDGSGHGYEFGIETTATPSFYVALNSGGTNSGNSDFANSTTYYVAVTIDASQNMTGFIGVVGGSAVQKVTANPGGTLNYATVVPQIGARYRSGGPTLFFNGYISSVAVYNKILTPALMNSHITAGSTVATVPSQATRSYISQFDYLRSPSGLDYQSLLGNSLRLQQSVVAGAMSLPVIPSTTVNLNAYDRVTIFDGPNSEVVTVSIPTNAGASSVPISAPGLLYAHAAGTPCCSDGVLGSLADQIVDASAWLESEFTFQALFQQTYTGEILPMPSMQASFDNQNMLVFRPKHFPVTAVSSIVLSTLQTNPVTFDATQAFIDANQQTVRVPSLRASGASQVYYPNQYMSRDRNMWLTISYTAGYQVAAMPPDIRQAVILLTSAILSRRQNPTGADQIDFADKRLVATMRGDTTGESLLVKEARKKVARYKVRSM